MDSNPAPFLNCAYTVLAPSSEDRVQDFEVPYGSQLDQEEPSLLKRIWATPDSGSVAESVSVIVTELVVAAPPLMMMEPVGGVVSPGGCRVMVSE